MLRNGSGALFELIGQNKKVKQILQKTEYVQVYNMQTGDKNILDPKSIGIAEQENL